MSFIEFADLMTLEKYDEVRFSFRKEVMVHKKNRQIDIGPDIILCFEDRTTVLYQIQEMLRTERIFEKQGIQEELNAYNPLIPDGSNLKATMMIQIPDVEARRTALMRLVGIEGSCWVKAGGEAPVFAVADEDIDRTTTLKTSAVHFLRFQLSKAMHGALKNGKNFSIGFDHLEYQHCLDPVPRAIADSLRNDLI